MQTEPTGISSEVTTGDRVIGAIDKGTRSAFRGAAGLAFGRRVKVRAHTRRAPRRRKR